jgi:hypothetical protein
MTSTASAASLERGRDFTRVGRLHPGGETIPGWGDHTRVGKRSLTHPRFRPGHGREASSPLAIHAVSTFPRRDAVYQAVFRVRSPVALPLSLVVPVEARRRVAS